MHIGWFPTGFSYGNPESGRTEVKQNLMRWLSSGSEGTGIVQNVKLYKPSGYLVSPGLTSPRGHTLLRSYIRYDIKDVCTVLNRAQKTVKNAQCAT